MINYGKKPSSTGRALKNTSSSLPPKTLDHIKRFGALGGAQEVNIKNNGSERMRMKYLPFMIIPLNKIWCS